MLSPQLSVALKEWDIVCQALASARQILLLRKGGIIEAIGGFELEQKQFFLFPTFLHQNRDMVKPEDRAGVMTLADEPTTITISSAAEVTDIIQLRDRAQMDALADEHIWLPPLIDMRFSYRPKNPLYLLLVRTYLLPTPITIENTPAYAGCKSWVPLERSIPTAGATPAINDEDFAGRLERIHRSLKMWHREM